jgi:hypothetical protein
MSKTTSVRVLRISTIELDFQPRENLIPEVVQGYIERLKRGDKLPPVRVRSDGKDYWLEDGFHRLEAARKIGRKTIAAEVIPGTRAEMDLDYTNYLKTLKAKLREERGAGLSPNARKIYGGLLGAGRSSASELLPYRRYARGMLWLTFGATGEKFAVHLKTSIAVKRSKLLPVR